MTESTTEVERFAPGIGMLRRYQRSWVRPDLLAGLTVWAMLVPQSLGYAALAGTEGSLAESGPTRVRFRVPLVGWDEDPVARISKVGKK